MREHGTNRRCAVNEQIDARRPQSTVCITTPAECTCENSELNSSLSREWTFDMQRDSHLNGARASVAAQQRLGLLTGGRRAEGTGGSDPVCWRGGGGSTVEHSLKHTFLFKPRASAPPIPQPTPPSPSPLLAAAAPPPASAKQVNTSCPFLSAPVFAREKEQHFHGRPHHQFREGGNKAAAMQIFARE
jgi:hypothetical protein